MAPITVTSSPLETCALAPTDLTRSTTESICSAVAPSFITIIIWSAFLKLESYGRWLTGSRAVVASGTRMSVASSCERAAGRLDKSPGVIGRHAGAVGGAHRKRGRAYAVHR